MFFLLALVIAAIPQAPNTTLIGTGATACTEKNVCIILATSAPLTYQFGADVRWCATNLVAPKLPLIVNWPTTPALCATDPASGVYKFLAAYQQSTAVTIAYSLNGVVQPPFTVPALPVPVKKIVLQVSCPGTIISSKYDDGSWSVASSGPTTCTTVIPATPSAQ